MHILKVGPDWSADIAAIRQANTDPTNLIRFGNVFYRLCSSAGSFDVLVVPQHGRADAGVHLKFNKRDLYIDTIGGVPFGRYASTLQMMSIRAEMLDNAVHALPSAHGVKRFEMQSLLAFSVAESLRFEAIADQIGKTIRMTTHNLIGVPSAALPVGAVWPMAHAWGQTSEAIVRLLNPDMQPAVTQPYAALTPEQRRVHQLLDLRRLDDADLQACAMGMSVLKRPPPNPFPAPLRPGR